MLEKLIKIEGPNHIYCINSMNPMAKFNWSSPLSNPCKIDCEANYHLYLSLSTAHSIWCEGNIFRILKARLKYVNFRYLAY